MIFCATADVREINARQPYECACVFGLTRAPSVAYAGLHSDDPLHYGIPLALRDFVEVRKSNKKGNENHFTHA